MAMEKKLGTALQTGVTASNLGGVHEQSATKSNVGELKVYKDKDGKDIAVYVTDKHQEYTVEALLQAGTGDKQVGDTLQIGGLNGVVTKWEVIESNEDVKKVSVGIRTFPDLQ